MRTEHAENQDALSPSRDFRALAGEEGFCMPSSYTAKPVALLLGGVSPRGTEEGSLLKREVGRCRKTGTHTEKENQRQGEMRQRQGWREGKLMVSCGLGSIGAYISTLQTNKNGLWVSSFSNWRGRQVTLV